MTSRTAKILLTLAAAGAVAVPTAAQARQGADDPVGHVRHAGQDDGAHHPARHHARRHAHRVAQHARHGADDGPNHARHGADDGPNHG